MPLTPKQVQKYMYIQKREIAIDFIKLYNNKDYDKMISAFSKQFYYTKIAIKVMLNNRKVFL